MRVAAEEISRITGCSMLAAELVWHGLRPATSEREIRGALVNHATASEVCDAILLAAAENYRESVVETFQKAGLLRSEDVGRIVFALVDAGVLVKLDSDTISDFSGLFEIADRKQ